MPNQTNQTLQHISSNMRVKFITPSKHHADFVNFDMYNLLRQELTAHGEVEIVDVSPDIVHIFGLWNRSYTMRVRHFRHICVPVVFTSIRGMLPLIDGNGNTTSSLSTRMAVRAVCSSGALIHTCGPVEKSKIEIIAKKSTSEIIGNPTMTSGFGADDMLRKFESLYVNESQRNVSRIRNEISERVGKLHATDDKCIMDICSRILYIKKRYIMQNIPLAFLQETADVMTNSDYDEDTMRDALAELKLYDFASYAMTLLRNNADLTEGFMPLAYTEGNLVGRMENVIIK